MRRIHVIVLAVSVALLACGCATSRRAGKASIPAGPGKGQPAENSTSTQPKGCPVSPCLAQYGFAIYDFRAIRDDYDRVSVIGEIRNVGSATRGVELQASLRDTGGHIAAIGHFCPASNRNIVPGDTWPFTYSFGRQEDSVQAELRIVGVFRTMDILDVASTTP
jgi:hypothetical protein